MINVVFPNYSQKVERLKVMELISDQMKIKEYDYTEYKRIKCVTKNAHCPYENVFQSFENLKKMILIDDIRNSHQFTFCSDGCHQRLYVSHPNTQQIIIVSKVDHECGNCEASVGKMALRIQSL